MTGDDTLARLASAVGIDPVFIDAMGVEQHASAETIEALCGALGFDAGTVAKRRAALGALRDEDRQSLLPPTVVVRKAPGYPVAIDMVIERERVGIPFEWTIALEGGAYLEGRVVPSDMPLVKAPGSGRLGAECRRWVLPQAPAHGYHRLHMSARGRSGFSCDADLVVAPDRCFVPPALGRDARMWGFAIQLYALRSDTNWGIGDFTDLGRFLSVAAGMGADIVGLNPLHTLFPSRPDQCSPYSPSTRLFLNPMYLDVTDVPGFAESTEAQRIVDSEEFKSLHARAVRAHLVDYQAVAALKLPVLEHLFAAFRQRHLASERTAPSAFGVAFRQFQRERGSALSRLGLFEALSDRFAGQPDWRDWPESFRTPDSDAVRRFAGERQDRIEFFQFLQWECDRQLRAASTAADMGVGLYQDLALGVDRTGAEAWANQDLLATGATIGAPSDVWNLKGQNWGLVPYDPRRLRRAQYRPLREMFRTIMAMGGAIRIDHVMALRRLFWIPEGQPPAKGAYVRNPFEDLLGIIALESWRQGCMVIGEDLGTVPAGFRERMQQERIYSYRLLYFERAKDGTLLPPEAYPSQAVASVSTHDLATLPGFWTGRDLAVRSALDLYPSAEAARDAAEQRREDRRRLAQALRRRGFLKSAIDLEAGQMPFELALAVHRYLAASNCQLMAAQLEDVLGVVDQANLPGTTTEYPNWRRKLEVNVEALADDPRVRAIAEAVRALRPGRRRPAQG